MYELFIFWLVLYQFIKWLLNDSIVGLVITNNKLTNIDRNIIKVDISSNKIFKSFINGSK